MLIVVTYAVYLTLSIAITVWVGQTLYNNGHRFLVDVFSGDQEMAHSVNHLLVVGFYLINLGYVALQLKIAGDIYTARAGIEAVASKVGMVLLGVGAMHFFNLFVFTRIRARYGAPNVPPVTPDGWTRIHPQGAEAV